MTILPSGYTVKRLPVRREDIVGRWKDSFGKDSDTAPNTHDGLLIDIIGSFAQANDEAGALSHNAGFFNTAVGLQLDNLIGGLFGTQRGQDTGSKGEVVVYGDPGTVLISASQVATRDAGVVYEFDAAAQIVFSDIVVFVFGPSTIDTITIIDINGTLYPPILPITGTGVEVAENQRISMVGFFPDIAVLHPVFEDPAGNGVLVVELSSIFNSSVTATASAADDFRGVKVQVTSTDPGDQPGDALTIVEIQTGGVTGWEGVVNLDRVTPGFLTDTDAEYRQRHLNTLGRNGSRTMPATISRLRDVTLNPGVESVELFNNPSFSVVDGRPPKSFEVVIQGGSDLTIASIINVEKPDGIETFGSTLIVIQDDRRVGTVDIRFTRPTQKHVWLDAFIVAGEGFPSEEVENLKNEVQNVLFDFGRFLGTSRDVYRVELKQQIQIPGIISFLIEMATTPNASDPKPGLIDQDLIISDTEISIWDIGKITVGIVI